MVAPAVFDTMDSTQEVQKTSEGWYDVTSLADTFFSIADLEPSQVQFAILWNGNQYAFIVSIQRNLNSQAYVHNLMREDLNLITIRAR